MKSRTIGIIVVAGIIVVGVVVGLFATGKLVWVKNGSQRSAVVAVCGTSIVNKYNDAMYAIQRKGASEPSIDVDGVKAIKAEIKTKSGYENDATCQALLFWIAIQDADYPTAKNAYDVVKRLHDKGIFADSNIRGNGALLSYEALLSSISPEMRAKTGAS